MNSEAWANQQAEKSITPDRSWISPIREFGRYLYSIGYEDACTIAEQDSSTSATILKRVSSQHGGESVVL